MNLNNKMIDLNENGSRLMQLSQPEFLQQDTGRA